MLEIWRDVKQPLNTKRCLIQALEAAQTDGIDTHEALMELNISSEADICHVSIPVSSMLFCVYIQTQKTKQICTMQICNTLEE